MIRNRVLKFIFLIGLFSFLVQFMWEWFQCVPYFIHRGTRASPISMVIAAFGDVCLIFLVLAIDYLLTRKKQDFLHRSFRLEEFYLIEVIAFFLAVGVEKIALATNRWSYTNINPLVPVVEVSVLPVIQLMLLVPIILIFTRIILRKMLIKIR